MPPQRNWPIISSLIISFAGYVLLAYFTPRDQFGQLISIFLLLFVLYGFTVRRAGGKGMLRLGLAAAILFRLLWLPAIPALSDDYFRFIWDGRLLANGINPYLILPEQFFPGPEASGVDLNEELFQGLNSPGYFTVYPPLLQSIFALSAWLFPESITGSVVVMRMIIILAEAGSFWLIRQLLRQYGLSETNVLLYALNPLVIAELSGNLHFEALMIFFLLLAVWFLSRQRWLLSALSWAMAVSAKLIPLMFLPFLIRRLGWQKSILFFSVLGLTLVLQFLPFMSRELLANFFSSVDLYFQKFEFNASVYYLVRWIGYQVVGYNLIVQAGPLLSLLVLILVLRMAYTEKQTDIPALFRSMLLSLSIYYLLATTVHPWYATPLVALCLFTPFRYPLLWSALIVLSYHAYQTEAYREIPWLTAIQYVPVIGYAGYELFVIPRNNPAGMRPL
jgi:alpha-1,6-mannosyltransferase